MAVAARAPLPHSALLQRERVSRTTFVYDDAGRLAEAVTVHDAEWTPDDVAKACGWDRWQHHPHHCPNGHLLAPWLDENGVELEDPPLEIVDAFCPACELLDDHRETGKGGPLRPGVYPTFREITDD